MNKYLTKILAGSIIILGIISILVYNKIPVIYNAPSPFTKLVSINGNEIFAEVADTPEKRSFGLMMRKKLDENQGMLFIFDKPGIYPFWMKNTLIPLDIIWISEDLKVVNYSQFTPPCKGSVCNSYTHTNEALYVLEVNAGWVLENQIQEGDKVFIE